MSRPVALAELAAFLEVPLEGDGTVRVAGFASLAGAAADDLVFLRDHRHLPALESGSATAVLTKPEIEISGRAVLRSAQPAHDFSRLMQEFAPPYRPPVGIDPSATVDPTAEIDASASVAAGVRIGPRCRVGPRTVLSVGVLLVADVEIGADGLIHAGVILREDTRLGDRVVLQPGVVLGGDGFGVVPDAEGRPVAMAQRGCVVLEDDVEIGANTTVDRATLDVTRIRRGAKIDNQVQIAHNCDIGEEALIVAQTGLAGGTTVGRRALVMAGVGSAGHLRIGDGAFVGARAGLHRDVPDGARVFGSPAVAERGWHRSVAALRRLPELLNRVRRLEKAVSGKGRLGEKSGPADEDPAKDR